MWDRFSHAVGGGIIGYPLKEAQKDLPCLDRTAEGGGEKVLFAPSNLLTSRLSLQIFMSGYVRWPE